MSSHLSRRWRRPHVGKKGNHQRTPCRWLVWLRRHDDRAKADMDEAVEDFDQAMQGVAELLITDTSMLAVTAKALGLCSELVARVHGFLDPEGLQDFGEWLRIYGTVSPVILDDGELPHTVHFHEGMQVRNFMRRTGLCDNWTDHDFDDHWVQIVCLALDAEKMKQKV